MAEWKIIVGSEPRTVKPVGKDTKERDTVYHQIITCDEYGFLIGDYEIVEQDKIAYTSKGELPKSTIEINGIFYESKGDKKFMSDFNGIVDAFIRSWKIPSPNYDITDVKLAIKYFKELIELKNDLLGLKSL